MNVLVVGYDRMGAHLVSRLARSGHAVTALDYQTSPNDPLINEEGVDIVPGSESLIADIRNIGTATIDAALALSDDDSRNAMAAQIAVHIFHIPEVVCRIEDPERELLYRNLGLDVISPTQLMTDTIVTGTFEQPR